MQAALIGVLFLISLNFGQDSTANFKSLEFSFGTAQMFLKTHARDELWSDNGIVIPSSATLFIGEYYWAESFSILFFFNLPLNTEKRKIDGVWKEFKPSASGGLGMNWAMFRIPIRDFIYSQQIAMGPSFILNKEHNISITAGHRFHLASRDGFSMYLGIAATVGIAGAILWYGVGHQF